MQLILGYRRGHKSIVRIIVWEARTSAALIESNIGSFLRNSTFAVTSRILERSEDKARQNGIEGEQLEAQQGKTKGSLGRARRDEPVSCLYVTDWITKSCVSSMHTYAHVKESWP